jgi:hypothetical protein
MAAPDYTVEFYLGGSWVDVSDYVLVKGSSIEFRRGRSRAFSPAATGTASFTLDNSDGRFSPGNIYSPYYPTVLDRVAVRIKVDTQTVFTGVVDSTTVQLNRSQVVAVVECVDILKSLSQTRIQSMAIEEATLVALANTGSACWPMSDLNATRGDEWAAWRDESADPIEIRGGFLGGKAGSHEFEQDAPPFMQGSIKIVPDDPTNLVGPVLVSPVTFNPGANGTVMFWFRATSAGYLLNMDRQSSGNGYMQLFLSGAGALTLTVRNDSSNTMTLTRSTSPATGVGMVDDAWHFVAMGTDTTGTRLFMYVDGATYTSSTGTTRTIGSTDRRLTIGGVWNWSTDQPTYGCSASFAGVAVYPSYAVTSSELSAIYNAGINGRSGQTVTQRVERLLEYVDSSVSFTAADVTSGFTVGGQVTAGKDLLACFDEIAEAEGGVFHANQNNDLRYYGYDAYSAPVDLTLTAAGDLLDGLEYASDADGFFNVLTVEGTTAGSVYREDATSVASDGIVGESRQGIVAGSQSLLEDYADRVLARAVAQPPGLRGVTVDVLTSENFASSRWVPLNKSLGTFCEITGLPSGVTGGTSAFGHIQGYSVSMSVDSLTMNVELSE